MDKTEKPQENWGHQQRRLSATNRSQPDANVNSVRETRRNAAACFKNLNKVEVWHAAFTGAMVVEGLKDGQKLWVNIYIRTDRKGRKYLSVVLKPVKGGMKR